MRTALSFHSVADFINYLRRNHEAPSTLLLCSTRDHIVRDIQASLLRESLDSVADNDEEPNEANPHHLLVNSIGVIASSCTIQIRYIPTLTCLRAYLTAYQPIYDTSSNGTWDPARPTLAIWGFIKLHRATADFTAQGLLRSLTLAVETAHNTRQDLIIAEPPIGTCVDDDGNDAADTPTSPWREQVPLLSGSVRVEGSKRVLAGQNLEIGHLMQKWCSVKDLKDEPPGTPTDDGSDT